MKKIVTFGEIMLRLSPEGYKRFEQVKSYEATFGGGEANVAVSLSRFGCDVKFVTKLPKNQIADSCVGELMRYGVDTSLIVRGGDRLGIYFCEKGASQRASQVIYDRAGSAIAEADINDFDFSKIFDGVDWFHFTGITPALSDSCAQITLEACKAAKENGVKISCDLNFRKKLWPKEKAKDVMSKLMEYVDLLIANEEDCSDVFDIKATNTDITGGTLNKDGYIDVARQVQEKFNVKKIAITLRESISASVNNWSAMLYNNGEAVFSKQYAIDIVDRVGGGDSFGAGLIYATLEKMSNHEALNFAVAASCLKHTVEGDFNLVSKGEVIALMGGDGSGRVQR